MHFVHDRDRNDGEAKREWTPGFAERLRAAAPELDMEAPERLPSSPYRDAVLDELAEG